jgi:hypothetical protein
MFAVVAVQVSSLLSNTETLPGHDFGIDTMPWPSRQQSLTVNQEAPIGSLYCAAPFRGGADVIPIYAMQKSIFLGGLSEGAVKM